MHGMASVSGVDSRHVEIVEVGPRDGLQNESVQVCTADKLELIRRAVSVGLRRIEVTSFVHPKRVPQMADAEAVCAGLPQADGVVYSALVLNQRGCDRAVGTGRLQEIGVVAVATDTFGKRNQGCNVADSVKVAKGVLRSARQAGLRAQVTVAVALGCPYEGAVSMEKVLHIVTELAGEEPVEIALADTAGVGIPSQVLDLFATVGDVLNHRIPLRGHFHNTRNLGMANAFAALQAGVQSLDASIAGIGGCPFAPGAAGNIATEDLVYMLGDAASRKLNLPELSQASRWLLGLLR